MYFHQEYVSFYVEYFCPEKSNQEWEHPSVYGGLKIVLEVTGYYFDLFCRMKLNLTLKKVIDYD